MSSRKAVINVALEVSDRWTGSQIHYEPGDHIGVFAVNDRSLVTGLMERLKSNCNFTSLPDSDDTPLQLQTFDKQQGVVCLIIHHSIKIE